MADEVTQEQKEEKKPSALESVIEELGDFGKKALKIGAVAALPFVYTAIDPSNLARAQVFTYTLTAGKATGNLIQNKPALDGVVKEAAIGTTLSWPFAKIFEGLNQLEARVAENYGTVNAKAAKIGTWVVAGQPAVVTGYTALNYGIGKKFREEWWTRVKTTFKYLALPSAINVGFLYQYGLFVQMAVAGALSYTFGLIQALKSGEGNIKNLLSTINPFSYISAGISATYKLVNNTVKGFYDVFYALGSTMGDYLKTPVATAPQTA